MGKLLSKATLMSIFLVTKMAIVSRWRQNLSIFVVSKLHVVVVHVPQLLEDPGRCYDGFVMVLWGIEVRRAGDHKRLFVSPLRNLSNPTLDGLGLH